MNTSDVMIGDMKVRAEGVSVSEGAPTVVTLHHIVGDDGLTNKERNLRDLKHNIPMYTAVEISTENEDDVDNGLRYFVLDHYRDCDGTPLYMLTSNRDHLEFAGCARTFNDFIRPELRGKLRVGVPEHRLKIFRPAEEIVAALKRDGFIREDGRWWV